jgi:membrane-associated phospholipid phosphatase
MSPELNSPSAIALSWPIRRLRSELRLKLVLTFVLNLWVYVPYHFLQWHHFFPPAAMHAGYFDRLVPFSDKAVWIYLSIYLLMPIGPFLMVRRQEIIRYAVGIMLISALADFVFVFLPTWCPRPDANRTTAAYRMLTAIDNPFNAFPSLHAAFAVFSALCAGRVLRELRTRAVLTGAVWLWTFLILFATLATRQHVMADVVGGSVLAAGVYIYVFRQWKIVPETKTDLQTVTANRTRSNSPAL